MVPSAFAGVHPLSVQLAAKFKSLVESIESMSVLDLNELVKLLEKKFGVSAAAVAAPAAGVGAAAAGDEKTSFNVELTDGGANKIAVIKLCPGDPRNAGRCHAA
jgi:large subunit ribosomal protein L7/L12